MQQQVVDQVWRMSETLCETEGMELVQVELHREPAGRILRLYIDKPGGINLDECADISRQVSDMLDVTLEYDWPYSLEVSSPGIERPLVKKKDFERFAGKKTRISTKTPIEGRRKFTGVLQGVSGEFVNILIDNKTVAIPFEEISKARLVNGNGENE
ncbi:MAG: ribosome maturation factor RimP [Desulfobacterales bacterium]|nr:ribosome maturation factor RimP [Desulfobacterales bacterium]